VYVCVCVCLEFPPKTNHHGPPEQKLVAIGLANIVGSIFYCMPTMGALGTTVMLAQFGGKRSLANAIAAVTVCCISLLFTSFFYYLPKCALALIVISAVIGLIDWKELYFLYRAYRPDLAVWCLMVMTTCAMGIEIGVQLALLVNLIDHVRRAGKSKLLQLGRVPGDLG